MSIILMMPQNVVGRIIEKSKIKCKTLKINFETCMKDNEDNIDYCRKLKCSYEECLKKMNILNYIKN